MISTRLAGPDDAATIARMLHDFNTEFGDPSPGVEFLIVRLPAVLAADDVTAVLGLVEDVPAGVGVLRFWPSLWSTGAVAYLEELYVIPHRRGQGIGGAIMATVIELARERPADEMYIGVDERDVAARRFYERLGFRNHAEGDPSARMFFYEREF